jgi:ribosomal protein S18 acetylase RimI-like enzyme
VSAEIRPAVAADLPDIDRIVGDAYRRYIDRIGRPPAPMTYDYAAAIDGDEHVVVLVDDGAVAGVLVTVTHPDHVHVETVAVDPSAQGRGHGRTLLEYAESQARSRGVGQVRLYTNEAMTENLAMYPHLGYVEVDRRVEDGYKRVYFVKDL